MTTSVQAEDISESKESSEKVASAHLLFPAAFLALGSILSTLTLLTARFPDLLNGPFGHGRLVGMAAVALVVGWLIPAGSGIVYYLLPRLTGAPLNGGRLAQLAGPGSGILAVAGMAVIGAGFGDGLQPLLLPWWLDIPVLAIATVPLVVTLQTLGARSERGVFVSLWFLLGAVVWLPLLYIAANLPYQFAIAKALQETVFTAGFSATWILAIGAGGAFYTATKSTGNPMGNRQLARVAFWSLAVGAIWAGPARLVLGATPDWLDKIAAVLGLAMPVATLAVAAGVAVTIDNLWERVASDPGLFATVAGLGLVVLLSALGSAGGFASVAGTVGFTSYWTGIDYGWWAGAGTLLFAGVIYQALPAITGKQVANPAAAIRGARLTLIGSLGVVISLTVSGVLTGFAWTGGSFATGAFRDIAPSWAEGLGPAGSFAGLAALFGMVAMIGQVLTALSIFRTVTSGRAGAQELLIRGDEQ